MAQPKTVTDPIFGSRLPCKRRHRAKKHLLALWTLGSTRCRIHDLGHYGFNTIGDNGIENQFGGSDSSRPRMASRRGRSRHYLPAGAHRHVQAPRFHPRHGLLRRSVRGHPKGSGSLRTDHMIPVQPIADSGWAMPARAGASFGKRVVGQGGNQMHAPRLTAVERGVITPRVGEVHRAVGGQVRHMMVDHEK